MSYHIDFENTKIAVAVSAAILDVVIAADDDVELEVSRETDHPLYEFHYLVVAESSSAQKWFIRIDGENGNKLEMRL